MSVGKKALVALIASLLTLGFLEFAARGYFRLCPPIGHVDRWEFRSTRPPAYERAEYFCKDFLAESLVCQREFVPPPGKTFLVPGDFFGRWINVSGGRRTTDFLPAAAQNRVLFFGGSTLFCGEVPDAETIASRLQLLINGSVGPRLAVENYGVPSMNAAQQLERLRTLELHRGDVVIFLDGVNDVYYSVYNGNARGWLPGDAHDGGVRKLTPLERLMHKAFLHYGDQSGLVRLLFNVQQRTLPHSVVDRETLDRSVNEAEAGYRQSLSSAREFAAGCGAVFFHFVQPNIFTLPRPSSHERWLIENELKKLPGLDRAFAAAYPRLRPAAAAACGPLNFDISDLLDDHDSRGEVYLDFCHVNHVANGAIARKIFESAFPSRGPSTPADAIGALGTTRQ